MKIEPIYVVEPAERAPTRRRLLALGLLLGGATGSLAVALLRRDADEPTPSDPAATPATDPDLTRARTLAAGPLADLEQSAHLVLECHYQHPDDAVLRHGLQRLARHILAGDAAEHPLTPALAAWFTHRAAQDPEARHIASRLQEALR